MKVHSPAQAPRGKGTVPLQTQSLFEVVLPLLSFSFQNTLSLGDSTLGSWSLFLLLLFGTKFPNIGLAFLMMIGIWIALTIQLYH